MVWDDFYGKQANPYDANDFRLILASLLATNDGSAEYVELIERTRYALEIEEQ